MINAEVQWLQRNDLTRLDYDARYAAESFNLIGLGGGYSNKLEVIPAVI